MKRWVIRDSVLLFILFFLVNSLVGFHFLKLFYLETNTLHGNIPHFLGLIPAVQNFQAFLHMDASQFSKLLYPTDLWQYLENAFSLLQHHHFLSSMYGVWPPGEPLILAGIFKLVGQQSYPWKMLMFSCLLWAATFVCVYHSLPGIRNVFVRIFISMFPLVFKIFCVFAFGLSIFLSEGPALPLFVIALTFLIRWLQNQKLRDIIMTAIFFALLAYIRGYFEVFAMFLTVILVVLMLCRKIKVTPILIALLVFNMMLMPWRLHNSEHTHSFSWSQLSSGVWLGFWEKNSLWPDANVPCKLEPQWCDFLNKKPMTLPPAFYRNLGLSVFITHPMAWYHQKLKHFDLFWFDGFDWVDLSKKEGWHRLLHSHRLLFIEGVLILLLGIVSTIVGCFFWRKKLTYEAHLFSIFSGIFIVFNLALFTFFHVETRYSLYLQVLFMYLPFWLFFGFKKIE